MRVLGLGMWLGPEAPEAAKIYRDSALGCNRLAALQPLYRQWVRASDLGATLAEGRTGRLSF